MEEVTFHFSLPENTIGWLEVTIKTNRQEFSQEVSDVYGGGIAELVIAVVAFYTLGTSQSVMFELEPGKPALRLDWLSSSFWQSGDVHIRVGEPDPPMVGWEAQWTTWDDSSLELDATCDRNSFIDAFANAVFAFVAEFGLEEYNRRWNSRPLSEHHLALLRELASLYRR